MVRRWGRKKPQCPQICQVLRLPCPPTPHAQRGPLNALSAFQAESPTKPQRFSADCRAVTLLTPNTTPTASSPTGISRTHLSTQHCCLLQLLGEPTEDTDDQTGARGGQRGGNPRGWPAWVGALPQHPTLYTLTRRRGSQVQSQG